MNMIERVARALATKHYCDRFDKQAGHPQILANVNANWHIFAGTVRIVIEAMREPTDLQRNEHYLMMRETGHSEISSVFMDATWERMVDAALKE